MAINLAGVSVETGDMIVCDRDGVVVVPFDQINEVLSKLSFLKLAEAEVEAKISAGLEEPEYMTVLMSSQKVLYLE